MTSNPDSTATPTSAAPSIDPSMPSATAPPTESYTKLAMRNMVRKSGRSLRHFALTVLGLLGLLIGLSYLTR